MAKPPVFVDLSFEEALARSRETGAIVIVDAMAVWCGPCQTMDRTTWVDGAVVARLTAAEPADAPFAIQIDVDAEPEVSGELEIRAMPTLVAFVGGEERDRLVGGRRASDILAWLDILARGETLEGAMRETARVQRERAALAPGHLYAGRHAEALEAYRWLWVNAPELATRHTSFARQLAKLVAEHAPARVAFGALRDAIAPPPGDAVPPLAALLDWTTLDRVLDDGDATLAWHAAHAAALPATPAFARLVEHAIVPLLAARDRWPEVGQALRDPAELFRDTVADNARVARTADDAGELVDLHQELAGTYARALYAAARDERADDLEFEARSADPSDAMREVLARAKQLGRADRGTWLLARERFAEAGPLLAEPAEQLARANAALVAAPSTTPAATADLRVLAGRLVRALRAARRDADVRAVGELAHTLDDSPEMTAALTDAGYLPASA